MLKFAAWLKAKLHGNFVGLDKWGNEYYESKTTKRFFGRKERWVLYKGEAEPSKIPISWFSWLHYQKNDAPGAEITSFSWEKERLPNLTGTNHAYYPPGSPLAEGNRNKSIGDYQRWTPPKNQK